MKKEDSLRNWFKDAAWLLLTGVCTAAIFSLFLFLVGWIAGKAGLFAGDTTSPLVNGFEICKDASFVIGAIFLFLTAGLIMVKGKQPEKAEPGDGWRGKFRTVGYQAAACIMAVCFLGVGTLADFLMRRIAIR